MTKPAPQHLICLTTLQNTIYWCKESSDITQPGWFSLRHVVPLRTPISPPPIIIRPTHSCAGHTHKPHPLTCWCVSVVRYSLLPIADSSSLAAL